MDGVVSPVAAFVLYLGLSGALLGLGRLLGGAGGRAAAGTTIYAGGEAPPARSRAAPGYTPYFATALFFAVLHLGVLVAATGPATAIGAFYVLGVLVILIALVLE